LVDIRKIFKKNIQKIFKKYSKNIRKVFGPCSVSRVAQHAHCGPQMQATHTSMQAGPATAPRARGGEQWTNIRKIFEKYSKNIQKIFGLCSASQVAQHAPEGAQV